MNRTLMLLIGIGLELMLATSSPFAQVIQSEPAPYVPGEVLLEFKPGVKSSEVDLILQDLGAVAVKQAGLLSPRLKKLSGVTVEDAVARYRSHPLVDYIEPNYLLSISEVPNDPLFDQVWGLHNTGQSGGLPGADIGAVAAWDQITDSRSVIVCVIDTGLDYLHEDLAANVWINPGEIPGNGTDDDGNGYVDDVHGYDFRENNGDPYDEHGHGTHVGGTIAAVGNNERGLVGVNWRASIMVGRFLNSAGEGSTEDAIRAIDYAINMGADILNNSYGGTGNSTALSRAIQRAQNAGVLFVAAAGNNRISSELVPFYPASYTHDIVVSVGASDSSDELANELLWGSNYGTISVDLLAPGVGIVSCLPGSRYGGMDGTSMATPAVSGALALMLANQSHLNALQAKARLLETVTVLPQMEGSCLTGGRLNLLGAVGVPDVAPPAQISDLAVGEIASDRLDLNWTAVGDDGLEGTAGSYDLRYASAPLDETIWELATQVQGEPTPAVSGGIESIRLTDLEPSTDYHFAIRAIDDAGNPGPLSASIFATTLGPPQLSVLPTLMQEYLVTGATTERMVTLANDGDGPYEFTIDEPRLNWADRSDAMGHYWTDSDDPNGPEFDWEDILSGGTLILSGQDEVLRGPFDIGFEFPFYGETFERFYVSSNGFLTFAITGPGSQNLPLPDPSAPRFLIAPLWTNLDPGQGGAVFLRRDADRVIVQFHGIGRREGGGPHTFQAQIYPDGTVEFHYLTLQEPVVPVTVGFQGPAGGPGLQIAYDEPYLREGLAVRFASLPKWLTVEPRSGTIPAGGSLDLLVSLDSADLCGDEFNALIPVQGNDPARERLDIPVDLQIKGYPHLALGASGLDFGRLFVEEVAERRLTLRNSGCDVLSITGIETGAGSLTVSPTGFSLAVGESRDVVLTYAPIAVETIAGQLVIASSDPDQPERTVDLLARAVEPPVLVVGATVLADTLLTGQVSLLPLTVQNAGGSELDLTLVSEMPWAWVLSDSIQIPAGESRDLIVQFDGRGQCTSVLNGDLNLFSNDPVRGRLSVAMQLSIQGAQDLVADVDTLLFEETFVGGVASLTWSLANEGCEILTVSQLQTDSPVFEITNEPIEIAPGTSRTLEVRYLPTFEGTATAKLLLTSDDPDQPIAEVNLQGEGIAAPQIVLDPVVVFEDAVPGQLVRRIVTVHNSGGSDLDLRVDSAAHAWVQVTPDSTRVEPGGSREIEVTLDATGFCGETQPGQVAFFSNDPDESERVLPVGLTVAPGPDVVVVEAELDFGTIYVGQAADLHLTIEQAGCLPATIESIEGTVAGLTALPDGFSLDPDESRTVIVTYAPTQAGNSVEEVILTSDDPDQPRIVIPVRAEVLVAPILQYTASGMTPTLYSGGRSTGSLNLRNAGGSDLAYAVSTEAGGLIPVGDAKQKVLAHGRPVDLEDRQRLRDEAIATRLMWPQGDPADRDAVPVKFETATNASFEKSSEEVFGAPLARYTGDGRTRGNLFHCTTSTTLREHRFFLEAPSATQMWFLVYEGLAQSGTFDLVSAADLSPAGPGTGWFSSGQIDQEMVEGRYYLLVASFAAVCSYYAETGIEEYPVPASFGSLILGAGFDWSPMTEFPPREQQLITGPFESPVAYYQTVLTGEGTAWLSLQPQGGVIPPGGQVDVAVNFDAVGLCDTEYPATIHVFTNDPQNPETVLETHLSVMPSPDIAISETEIDFGLSYPDTPITRTLEVRNPGCDILTVEVGTRGDSAFETHSAPAEIPPGETLQVEIVFDPPFVGTFEGALTLSSDDPDEPLLQIPLVGRSQPAPWIVANPHALVDTVEWGSLSRLPLTVTNSGGSDLEFQVVLDPHLIPAQDGKSTEVSIAGLSNILVMESDTGERYFHQALNNLGLQHTFVTSYISLQSALTGNVYWDLVIVNNYADFPDVSILDDITAYLSSGRPLILTDWVFGDYSERAIALRLGVDFQSNFFTPENFAAEQLDHGLFSHPNEIGHWEWTDNQGVRDGQLVVPVDGAVALAGFDEFPGMAAIVQNAERNGLFNAFQPVNFNGDHDGDGKLDMVELCENEILYMIHSLEWLTVFPGQGVIPAGETMELEVTLNGREIFGGWLEADVRLLSNDPQRPDIRVPVTMGLEGVSSVEDGDLPAVYHLADNVPNPFNPSTVIAFDLPQSSTVRLKIFDVRGSLVKTLLEEERAAGRHSVVWNGRDRRDRQVASGVYFYRITAGDYQAVRRMVLLK